MADKDHIRLKVMRRLTAHLEGITEANGYNHNLNGAVFRGRAVYGNKDPVPMVSILEGKGSEFGVFADTHSSVRKDDWVLLVQGFVADDPRNPTDPAYALLTDVERRLSDIIAVDRQGQPAFNGLYMLQGLITSFKMASPVVRPPEDGLSSKAFFYLPIRVGLAVDLTQPWQGSKEINR